MKDIEQLLKNEREIRALIGTRLTALQNDIGQLRRNLQGANTYHRQLLQS
ncbi:flagellar protein FliT [Sodalis sp. (in: enterobacteria)]